MTRWSDLSDAELDERLTGDLQEFTNATPVDERWAAGTLLPAVRVAISREGPRPTRAPRFAGFAGLAAVLAVVVIVILVVPRVVPGPAASPSAVAGLDDPSASTRVECPYADQNGQPSEVSVADLAGVVVGCTTKIPATDQPPGYEGSGASLSNPDGNTSRLEVLWMESALCDTFAQLELMRVETGYILVVDSLP